MSTTRTRVLTWCGFAVTALLMANVLVAVGHTGSTPGRSYRWVCRDTGAELTHCPSQYGGTRLTPGRGGTVRRWELVEPRPPSAVLPWNWLAVLVEPSPPDPEAVILRENLRRVR